MSERQDVWMHHWITAEQDTRPIRVRRPKPRPKSPAKLQPTPEDHTYLDQLERSLHSAPSRVA